MGGNSSTMSSSKRRFYYHRTKVSQSEPPLLKHVLVGLTRPFVPWNDPNFIHIHIIFRQQTASRLSIYSPIHLAQPKIVSERRLMFPISDDWGLHAKIIAAYLSTMCIPKGWHGGIIPKIHGAIQAAELPLGLPIEVIINDVTVNVLRNSVVPPPKKSVFHQLDRVRLDSLESSIRQQQCDICLESLDHCYDAEEGIARLPCSHLFHAGCLVQSLELDRPLSPVCPVCRRPLTFLKLGEPSFPWEELYWQIWMLKLSAGLFTSVLLCKLLKRVWRP